MTEKRSLINDLSDIKDKIIKTDEILKSYSHERKEKNKLEKKYKKLLEKMCEQNDEHNQLKMHCQDAQKHLDDIINKQKPLEHELQELKLQNQQLEGNYNENVNAAAHKYQNICLEYEDLNKTYNRLKIKFENQETKDNTTSKDKKTKEALDLAHDKLKDYVKKYDELVENNDKVISDLREECRKLEMRHNEDKKQIAKLLIEKNKSRSSPEEKDLKHKIKNLELQLEHSASKLNTVNKTHNNALTEIGKRHKEELTELNTKILTLQKADDKQFIAAFTQTTFDDCYNLEDIISEMIVLPEILSPLSANETEEKSTVSTATDTFDLIIKEHTGVQVNSVLSKFIQVDCLENNQNRSTQTNNLENSLTYDKYVQVNLLENKNKTNNLANQATSQSRSNEQDSPSGRFAIHNSDGESEINKKYYKSEMKSNRIMKNYKNIRLKLLKTIKSKSNLEKLLEKCLYKMDSMNSIFNYNPNVLHSNCHFRNYHMCDVNSEISHGCSCRQVTCNSQLSCSNISFNSEHRNFVQNSQNSAQMEILNGTDDSEKSYRVLRPKRNGQSGRRTIRNIYKKQENEVSDSESSIIPKKKSVQRKDIQEIDFPVSKRLRNSVTNSSLLTQNRKSNKKLKNKKVKRNISSSIISDDISENNTSCGIMLQKYLKSLEDKNNLKSVGSISDSGVETLEKSIKSPASVNETEFSKTQNSELNSLENQNITNKSETETFITNSKSNNIDNALYENLKLQSDKNCTECFTSNDSVDIHFENGKENIEKQEKRVKTLQNESKFSNESNSNIILNRPKRREAHISEDSDKKRKTLIRPRRKISQFIAKNLRRSRRKTPSTVADKSIKSPVDVNDKDLHSSNGEILTEFSNSLDSQTIINKSKTILISDLKSNNVDNTIHENLELQSDKTELIVSTKKRKLSLMKNSEDKKQKLTEKENLKNDNVNIVEKENNVNLNLDSDLEKDTINTEEKENDTMEKYEKTFNENARLSSDVNEKIFENEKKEFELFGSDSDTDNTNDIENIEQTKDNSEEQGNHLKALASLKNGTESNLNEIPDTILNRPKRRIAYRKSEDSDNTTGKYQTRSQRKISQLETTNTSNIVKTTRRSRRNSSFEDTTKTICSQTVEDLIENRKLALLKLKKDLSVSTPTENIKEKIVFKKPEKSNFILSCPKSPDKVNYEVSKPVIIPLEKVIENSHSDDEEDSFEEGVLPLDIDLARKLISDVANLDWDKNLLSTVAGCLAKQKRDFVATLIVSQVSQDFSQKFDKTFTPPAPLMTVAQQKLLVLLSRLESSGLTNIKNAFLRIAERRLLSEKQVEVVHSLTRLYVAVCKLNYDIEGVRMLCCNAAYFMGDLFLPLFYIVVTMWSEVLPNAPIENSKISEDLQIAMILVQVIHTKKCREPGYNVASLDHLLKDHFGYKRGLKTNDEIMSNLVYQYSETSSKLIFTAILILCKNSPTIWIYQQIKKHLLPLIEKYINCKDKVQLVSSLSYLINRLLRMFHFKNDKEYYSEILSILGDLKTRKNTQT